MSIASVLASWNIPYDGSFDKYESLLQTITMRNLPAAGGDTSLFYNETRPGCSIRNPGAHVAIRGMFYCKANYGDCGNATPVSVGGGLVAIKGAELAVGTTGALAASGASGASLLTTLGLSAGVSSGLAVGTAGLSLLLAPILGIIQHHAQAVAAEQGALCAASSATFNVFPAIDNLVRSGQLTVAQGIAAFEQAVNQIKAIIQTVAGPGASGHPCNAGCMYLSLMDVHLDFVKTTYYTDIAPVAQSAGPVAPGSYAPAASASTTLAVLSSSAPASGSPAVTASFPWSYVLLALAMLAGVIYFARR